MQLKHMRPYQLRDYVEAGHPLLVPAGCIETHGPHMAIGHDTIIVEEICQRIAERTPCAIAPSFEYGPTGYALGGPEDGTIDVTSSMSLSASADSSAAALFANVAESA